MWDIVKITKNHTLSPALYLYKFKAVGSFLILLYATLFTPLCLFDSYCIVKLLFKNAHIKSMLNKMHCDKTT